MNFVLDLLERHEPMFWLFGILIAALALNRVRLSGMKAVPRVPRVREDDDFLKPMRYETTNRTTGLPMTGPFDSAGCAYGDER